MPPKISIVTPSYNQGKYLEETILSVINQGYPNLEYIIIDGGSTDNTIDIIRKYEKHLAYWVSEKDEGMYHAIQKGFEKSTGDVMAWINSDDKYHEKAMSVVAEVFSEFPGVRWIQGLPSNMDEKGRIVKVVKFRKWSKYNYLLNDYATIQQESCFWRRSLWDEAGGAINTSLKFAGDFDLWLRFFDHSQLHCLDTVLGCFRARSSNQKSVEHLSEYSGEVKKILDEKRRQLSPDEKKHLARLSRYRQYYRVTPFLRILYYNRYIRNLQYPPAIKFSREQQKFYLEADSLSSFLKRELGYDDFLHGKY